MIVRRCAMPYRVDVLDVSRAASDDVLDRLVELGALDVERLQDDAIAAVMPDGVTPERIAQALGHERIAASPAVGRDADSVWLVSPRAVRVGRLSIVPGHAEADPGVLRLIDARAFGTGLHPTTALCLEALDEATQPFVPDAVLDVGTGSGVLALAALTMGVPHAMGIDVDEEAVDVARENAWLNGMSGRLELAVGSPDLVSGTWPLVFANILAAPLIEMAPVLVRRVAHHGRLVLSGIPSSVEPDVSAAYRRLGMRSVEIKSSAGWVALVLQASW
jgi:ribosomal protein L11 methyltransferase